MSSNAIRNRRDKYVPSLNFGADFTEAPMIFAPYFPEDEEVVRAEKMAQRRYEDEYEDRFFPWRV